MRVHSAWRIQPPKSSQLQQHRIELAKCEIQAAVPADLLGGRDAQDRQLKLAESRVAVDKAAQDLASQKTQTALDLRVKDLDVAKAKAVIDEAEQAITELVLTAPRDGIVVIENHPWSGHRLHVSDQVAPGMTVASIPDQEQGMRVHADLSDVDDGRVKLGMTGTCTLDAYPNEPIACTVDQLTPVARPKTGQGSLRRAFSVELSLAHSDPERMRPGMSVEVELHAAEKADVLAVPRGAVIHDKSVTRVRLASGELRDVALGLGDAQAYVVEHGLAEGDRVVIGGAP